MLRGLTKNVSVSKISVLGTENEGFEIVKDSQDGSHLRVY